MVYQMDELEFNNQKIEDSINSDDFEAIMIECIQNIEINYNESNSIEPHLNEWKDILLPFWKSGSYSMLG